MDDLISRQEALDALGEEPPVWYDGEDEIAERDQWRRDVAAIEAVGCAQPEQHERIFQEIVVEYPSISTYPEYEGKPYFSIKYVEDGRGYIGYGTYNPEVLSEYMKEYFIPSAERKKGWWDYSDDMYETRVCSVCGFDTEDYKEYDFCPNCGAGYDEEEFEEPNYYDPALWE